MCIRWSLCSFQIFLAINVIEWLQSKIKELPGYKPGDYLGTWEWVEQSDEGWDSYQTKELNNGRLAMVRGSELMSCARLRSLVFVCVIWEEGGRGRGGGAGVGRVTYSVIWV